jgi:hypothetical protein
VWSKVAGRQDDVAWHDAHVTGYFADEWLGFVVEL